MSLDRTWQSLSVQEFIADCNWLGIPSPSQILSEVGDLSNSLQQLQQALQGWETKTAQEFFALNNWDGQLVFATTNTESERNLPNLVLDFNLSNQQFWQCFAWLEPQNITTEIVDAKTTSVSESVAEFTLNNLSELF